MKKWIAVIMATVALLVMSVPATAQTSVTTGVTVLSGSGLAPMVKAKWETTSATPDSESGDPSHLVAGTQVLPNIGWQAQTDIWFWAVVTDPAGVGNIAHVYADVYYPASGPVDPGPNGSLKFEVELTLATTDGPALSAFNAAYAAGLVTLNPDVDLADIQEELIQQSAGLYVGYFHFDNCQMAGDYPVTFNAANRQNVHGFLSNVLQWLPLTGAEWDFNAVNYGTVAIGVHKQIDGNYTWDGNAGAYRATIRNIGNTYLKMTVKQDDMGLGKTNINGVDTWNVHYDARLGSDPAGMVNYDPVVAEPGSLTPFGSTTLNQVLRLCALDKVDFSIRVDKDSTPGANHIYAGTMVLGAVVSAGPATNGVVQPPEPEPGTNPF